jgi:large subunit ribosomal protein L29
MKQEVVRELSTNEIRERLEEEKKQLTKLKLNHAVSPLENPNKIKAYRKTIARLVTEIRKRAIAEALSAKAGTNKSSLK